MKNMYTKNNKHVIIPQSAVAHMEAHADVSINKLKEALKHVTYEGGFYKASINLGRVIGKTSCVEVGPNDDIQYFYRKNRSGVTPFVRGRELEDTTNIVVILREGSHGEPILVTSWYGDLAPMEPWDARRKHCTFEEIQECDEFWSSHALVYDESCIDMQKEMFENANRAVKSLSDEET